MRKIAKFKTTVVEDLKDVMPRDGGKIHNALVYNQGWSQHISFASSVKNVLSILNLKSTGEKKPYPYTTMMSATYFDDVEVYVTDANYFNQHCVVWIGDDMKARYETHEIMFTPGSCEELSEADVDSYISVMMMCHRS